jgi:hypothetical protein
LVATRYEQGDRQHHDQVKTHRLSTETTAAGIMLAAVFFSASVSARAVISPFQ